MKKNVIKKYDILLFSLILTLGFSLFGCTSGMDILHGCLESVVAPLGSKDFRNAASPNPTVKSAYDHDYQQMLTYYLEYVKNYASMKQTLAYADNQNEAALNLGSELDRLKLDSSTVLMQCDTVIEVAKAIKAPMPKLNKATLANREAAQKAKTYMDNSERNFKRALTLARAISQMHYNDFKKEYDKDKNIDVLVGPGFKLPSDVQEKMNRIDDIASVIKNINGMNILSSILEEFNSWFEEDAK